MSVRSIVAAAGAGVLLLQQAGAAAAFQIVPHRAMYSMDLATSGNSDVADVNGSLMFEWADSCDGWTVTQRYKMTFLYATGQQMEIAYNLVSWESKDGLRYRFFVRRTENGEAAKELRGDARLDAAGGSGTAHYTLPEDKTVPLPAGTLFPTAHSLKLLERAEAGQTFVYARVFDGNDEKGLFDVSAAIAPRPAGSDTAAAAVAADVSTLLRDGPAWGIALAFYNNDTEAAAPDHEQFVTLHDNGIVDALRFDYGKFTVAATLKKLEKLPTPSC